VFSCGVTDDHRLARGLATDLDGHFPDLVRIHQHGIYAGTLRMTGCRQDAEDLSQETFARAYRALTEYPPERVRSLEVRAWLWTIAANLCRNHARTRARRPVTAPMHERPEPHHVDPDPPVDLASALVNIPWTQRAPVVMHHVVGMPVAEIAAALGRPEGTVKSQIHRGLDGLRRALEAEEP
jgi:RNA polymerase sigma factor (sigma-70 family)